MYENNRNEMKKEEEEAEESEEMKYRRNVSALKIESSSNMKEMKVAQKAAMRESWRLSAEEKMTNLIN